MNENHENALKTLAFFNAWHSFPCSKSTISKSTWKKCILINSMIEIVAKLEPIQLVPRENCDKCDKSLCNFDVLLSVFSWVELIRLRDCNKMWVCRQCTWFEIQNSAISEVSSQFDLSTFCTSKKFFFQLQSGTWKVKLLLLLCSHPSTSNCLWIWLHYSDKMNLSARWKIAF